MIGSSQVFLRYGGDYISLDHCRRDFLVGFMPDLRLLPVMISVFALPWLLSAAWTFFLHFPPSVTGCFQPPVMMDDLVPVLAFQL